VVVWEGGTVDAVRPYLASLSARLLDSGVAMEPPEPIFAVMMPASLLVTLRAPVVDSTPFLVQGEKAQRASQAMEMSEKEICELNPEGFYGSACSPIEGDEWSLLVSGWQSVEVSMSRLGRVKRH